MDNLKSGYFLVYRSTYDHPLLDDKRPETRRGAWLDLIAHAQWEDVKTITLKAHDYTLYRGEQARSKETLRKSWGWSKATVDRFIKQLEAAGMIKVRSDAITTVITICNYDKHQGPGKNAEKASQVPSQPTSQAQARAASQVQTRAASQVRHTETPCNDWGLQSRDLDREPSPNMPCEPGIEPSIEPGIEPADEVQINKLINKTSSTRRDLSDGFAAIKKIDVSEWHLKDENRKFIQRFSPIPDDFIDAQLCNFLMHYTNNPSPRTFAEWSSHFQTQCTTRWKQKGQQWGKHNDSKDRAANQPSNGPKLSAVASATQKAADKARRLQQRIDSASA